MALSWFEQQRAKRQQAMTGSAAPIPPSMGYQPPTTPQTATGPDQQLHGSVDGVNPSATPQGSVAPGTGLPPGYSMDPITGGGYTLANYTGPGLMAPNTNVPQTVNPDTFRNSDAYRFILDEGNQAIERSAAAKGTLLTGGTLKDLTRWSQGHANTFYGDEFDRNLGVYDRVNNNFENNRRFAYDALSGLGSYGLNAAHGQSGAFGAIGNAQAAGTLGKASAINQGATAVANTLGEYFARRRAAQQDPSAGGFTLN